MVCSSFCAGGVNETPFSFSSSADSMMLTAWSATRSKSPIRCSSIDDSTLSCSLIGCVARCTRKVPSVSSYRSVSSSRLRTEAASSGVKCSTACRLSCSASSASAAMRLVSSSLLTSAMAGVANRRSSSTAAVSG